MAVSLEHPLVPRGWARSTLGEVSHVITDGTHKTPDYQSKGVRFISIMNIRPFRAIDWEAYSRFVSPSEHQQLIKRCRPERDDILFPRIGTLGFAKRVDTDEEFSIFVGLGLIKPDSTLVVPKFLEYFMNTPLIKRLSIERATGTGRKTLALEESRRLPCLVAPLVEQRAIVAKIDALFSELDKGVEQLQIIKQQLKQYRQAVLKAAFEGKLTAAWRAEQQAAGTLSSADELPKQIRREREAWYQQRLDEWKRAVANSEVGCGSASREKKPKPPTGPESLEALAGDESASLPLLPEGWVWMAMPWLLSFDRKPMTTGPFGTMLKKQDHRTEGVPVLGIENIGEGRFVPGNRIFVTEGKADDLSSFAAEAGDIIVSRSGTVGEICRVPDGLGRVLISSNLMRLSLNAVALIPELFVLMFQPGSPVKHQVKGLWQRLYAGVPQPNHSQFSIPSDPRGQGATPDSPRDRVAFIGP